MMEASMQEIRRVLKQGGLVYISEPVFAGDFNEILLSLKITPSMQHIATTGLLRNCMLWSGNALNNILKMTGHSF